MFAGEALDSVLLDRAELSFSEEGYDLRGRLAVTGHDAHVLIELLRAPDAVGLAFAGVRGADFSSRARLQLTQSLLTLEQLTFRAANLSVTGRVSVGPAMRKGALLLDYGGVRIGVRFAAQEQSVAFEPPPGWLLGSGS